MWPARPQSLVGVGGDGGGGGSNFGGARSTDLQLAEGAFVDEPVGSGVTQAAIPG